MKFLNVLLITLFEQRCFGVVLTMMILQQE